MARARESWACLDTAALVFIPHDIGRARELGALSWVRRYYDQARCSPIADPAIAAQLNFATPETIDRKAVEHGLIGAARIVSRIDPAPLYAPPQAWSAAVVEAADSAEAYAYAVDLKKVCALSSVRPEAEWRGIRQRIRAAVEAAAAP